ncbi:hypothetical protein [Sulfitobacter sp.]|uniref:hypothetical protein n=1 Tax=Sulfitobacter sp. TaxID=1903071 RepID=UPI003297A0DD
MTSSTHRKMARSIVKTAAEQTGTEMKALTAELVVMNGFQCGRVLAVRPTRRADIWRISCMADGAMDALATYQMDARTGIVSA